MLELHYDDASGYFICNETSCTIKLISNQNLTATENLNLLNKIQLLAEISYN